MFIQWYVSAMDATTVALLYVSTIIRSNGFSTQNLWKTPVWYDKINIMSDLYAGLRKKQKIISKK